MTPVSCFVVDVGHLRRSPGLQWHRTWREPMADLVVTGSAVPAGQPVELDVVLESVLGGVRALGVVRFGWAGACRRCLRPAAGSVEVAVAEMFTPGSDGEDTYPLVGDLVDLEPLVRDAVLLELPPAPLCHPGCRGLCPACGTDRNVATCRCGPALDGRWAALDQLYPAPARRAPRAVSAEDLRSSYRAAGPTTR